MTLPVQPPPSAEPRASGPPDTPPAISASDTLAQRAVKVLRGIRDPEVPVNIYDLGLIYALDTTPAGGVHVRMTLTSPACPIAGSLPGEIESKLRQLAGVTEVKVEVVWDPPWSQERMSEAAKLRLGML
jgi:FeS assembly SUF system protein